MASSHPHQILLSYGAFFLPLAVLAGLSVSVILPAALSFLILSMESALFISLPSLWSAFLSWITPSCLFVLSNGIIVVLTASSGGFSSSESCSGFEFYASALGKMGSSQVASSGASMADSSALDSRPKLLPNKGFAEKRNTEAAMKDTYLAFQRCSSCISRGSSLPVSSQSMLDTHIPVDAYHDACVDVREAEEPKAFPEEEDDVYEYPSYLSRVAMESKSFLYMPSDKRNLEEEKGEEDGVYEYPSYLSRVAMESKSFLYMPSDKRNLEEEKEEDDGVYENPSYLSRVAMESKSFLHMPSNERNLEEEKEKEEEGGGEGQQEEKQQQDNKERLYELPKLNLMSKSFSFGCPSEPSSPQFTPPLKATIMKRSLSVDSASFKDHRQAPYVSPEELSDEAFRKRVEDFISRKNAQLRSQAS